MFRKLLTGIILSLFMLGGYLAVTALALPNVHRALETGIEPSQTSQVLGSDRSVVMAYGKYQHKPVSLSQIPPTLIDALLATEDRRFYMHKGVDPIGVMRAIVMNIKSHGVHEGGSTLTQQLARNLFLSNERSLQRKIKEALLAVKLESQLSKQQILEMYLNHVYFGEGAYGVGAAANIYFGKTPRQLSPAECALLAGMPQAPSLYSPFSNPQLAKRRRNEVLQNLVEVGKLSQEKANRLKTYPIHLNANGRASSSSDKAPFFNRYVLQEALQMLDMDEQTFWQQGLKIQTTLDPRAQRLAENQVVQMSAVFGRTGRQQQAALVSLNATGGMIAYVGGKNFAVSQFDRASQAKRLAGSLFKVFVYTTAMEQGMSPLTVYKDAPVTFGTWTPANYDKRHHGFMTLAQALTQSNNIIAVKLLHDLGADPVIQTARRMGIQSNLQPNLSLALGAANVSLLEMTSAFSVFSHNGFKMAPYAIEKITDRGGHILYQHQPQKTLVLQRVARDTMVSMMQGVIRYGTGKGANIGRPAAGKTGTSDDYRDAWFIGYTPGVTTGVWVGNDDNSKMPGLTGGSIPARIWRGYMSQLLAGLPKRQFDLSYAKPLTEKDFFVYNLDHLSHSETAVSPDEQAAGEVPAETPTDPEGTGTLTDPTQPLDGEAPFVDPLPNDAESPPPALAPVLVPTTAPSPAEAAAPTPKNAEARSVPSQRYGPPSQPVTRPQRFEPRTGWGNN